MVDLFPPSDSGGEFNCQVWGHETMCLLPCSLLVGWTFPGAQVGWLLRRKYSTPPPHPQFNLKSQHFNIQGPVSRSPDPGSWIQDPRYRIQHRGSGILDAGSQMLDPGSLIQGLGCRVLDPESRVLDLEFTQFIKLFSFQVELRRLAVRVEYSPLRLL